jgi:sec-independent protein translocase protein TatB
VFDIGFTELLLCLVVALVVIGPEQLPGTVRTVALWIGRLKRSLAETRTEIERQIGADDIRRQLHNEEIMRNIEETRLQLEASLREHGVLDNDQHGNPIDANLEHTPSAADYGPPEELPDHAHGEDNSANTHKQTANPAATKAAAGNTTPSVPPGSQATAVTTQAPHNNQQSQAPAATVAPHTTGNAGQ